MQKSFLSPDELPKPPFDWPQRLTGMDGSTDLLSGIKVWYDFNWKEEFRHTRNFRGFPNSHQLTALVKTAAPEGKTPQLVLTKIAPCPQDRIETDTEFVLVVNIDEFKSTAADKAVSLFARKLGGSIVTYADVREFVETTDGGKTLLSLIKKQTLRDWMSEEPQRVAELLEVLYDVLQVVALSDDVRQRLLNLCLQADPDTLAKIAQCLISAEPTKILSAFDRLELSSLESLNAAVNLGVLKATLAEWEKNKTCKDEVEFWQKWFRQRPFILSQLFHYPIVIMEGNAYVGGTAPNRKGSRFADFRVKNTLTKNTAIIEIKTPVTPLVVDTAYRDGFVHSIHPEMTGAIVQAASYKHTYLAGLTNLRENARTGGSDTDFEAFEPPLIVIAGSLTSLEDDLIKRRSFELFRNHLSNIQLVTFDELFERISGLVELLESGLDGTIQEGDNLRTPPDAG